MRDYLLFIDTETSGLPVSWDVPYSEMNNWPFSVQIAWVIYTKSGELLKKESHFINNNDFDLSPAAYRIHGLSKEFLHRHGEDRAQILMLLKADLEAYQPLVVAHFMQLDFHMIGADFYRVGKENPLQYLPKFCTMLASARYVSNPKSKYLRLNRLYYVLFKEELRNQHEALTDATATAACFFEMQRLGDINATIIAQQQENQAKGMNVTASGCSATLLILGFLTYLFSLWL